MIDKPADVTKFDKTQVPVLSAMLNKLFNNAAGIRCTDIEPTVATVHEGEIVIYDNGAGTKELYVVTGAGNLGKIVLT